MSRGDCELAMSMDAATAAVAEPKVGHLPLRAATAKRRVPRSRALPPSAARINRGRVGADVSPLYCSELGAMLRARSRCAQHTRSDPRDSTDRPVRGVL